MVEWGLIKIKLIETLLTQFRMLDVTNNYNAMLTVAFEIVNVEDTVEASLLKKLEWIRDHTTKRVNSGYYQIARIIMTRNIPVNMSIEVKVGYRKTIEMDFGELLTEIEIAHQEINMIVNQIAKKYSIDIPFKKFTDLSVPEIPMEKE